MLPNLTQTVVNPFKNTPEFRILRNDIKKMAESRNYKVLFEEPILGEGLVDVGLFKNEVRIAVEIYVVTPEPFEIQNIQKCIIAGYNPIIVCSKDRKILETVWKIVETTLDFVTKSKILFLDPKGLLLYLDQLAANELSSEQIIKGYRVKVEYTAVPEDVAKAKLNSILKILTDSIRREKRIEDSNSSQHNKGDGKN